MKTSIIIFTLLLSFNCLAQVKIDYTDPKGAPLFFEEPTLNKAVKRLKKIILSKRRFKGDWSLEESGNIFKREKTRLVATGIIREDEVLNIETGLNETVTIPEYEEETYFEYFKPSNFSVSIEDISEQLATAKAERQAKRDEMIAMKEANFDKKSSESVSEWRTRIAKVLKRIIRDARSE